LRLRIPRWCAAAKVTVDGRPVEQPVKSGEFLAIPRQWKTGDRVEIDMPMPWRLVAGRKAQSGCVAILRGPVVFCLSRARHKELAGTDLRLLTLVPSSLEGPVADDSIRPGGLACKVQAWGPGAWYPHAKPDRRLVLTEYPDPSGEAAYFHVPNPRCPGAVPDELVQSD